MYELQTTVTVGDTVYHITNKGDFRMVLDCFNALNDSELGEDYRVLASLLIFYNEFNSVFDVSVNPDLQELTKAMYKFFNCGQDNPPGHVTSRPLIDWNKDETLLCSAVNNVAKKEIRETEYLHWWTFMGYYMSIGESVLSTVVSIRDKIVNHKKLEKWEQEFRKNNPQYFIWNYKTVAEQEDDKLIRELWNKGGQ